MDDDELDRLIAQRLPEWFEPDDHFASSEVFALLVHELGLQVDPEDVDKALERLADRQGGGLHRLRPRFTPRWDRLYALDRPPLSHP